MSSSQRPSNRWSATSSNRKGQTSRRIQNVSRTRINKRGNNQAKIYYPFPKEGLSLCCHLTWPPHTICHGHTPPSLQHKGAMAFQDKLSTVTAHDARYVPWYAMTSSFSDIFTTERTIQWWMVMSWTQRLWMYRSSQNFMWNRARFMQNCTISQVWFRLASKAWLNTKLLWHWSSLISKFGLAW
jgi:hypothetical protein